MSRIEEFEEARPLLFSIARRMLGSAGRAEDAVHQAWLHYEATPEQPASAREFLTAAVTRICLDALRRPRPRRDRHPGPWLPEPSPGGNPAEAPPTAVLSLLERLNPLERAVFVLREVLGCGPAQIASAVGCSEAACHQLTAAVSRACDGGAAAPSWPRRIAGAEHVARVLATIVPALVRVGVTLEPRQVDHRPGVVFRDRNGTVLSALALDILDGRIHTIRWVRDPDLSTADTPAPT
ncbi:RNA polymerase subunit sigma-24 [Streptomyces sp. S3(2020)]|uniref:sigma factor-like helix-turn-helix DNA-binding protein n=1 Tax=Streptomyces sp. S3(2020) TaxID=2732044 RepID=UPI0014891F5A|nr:sigma factor-like helix-turn-helix DNA-binding protein [Streptomyces sp. S3(2020)]NNN35357.1 RNA polymerase subunit sigma-24 [Streptomyces sp. S3(2020)]